MGTRRGFGAIRKLPSGRHQASYVGPDGQRHTGDDTFKSKPLAEAWLVKRRADIYGDEWEVPVKAPPVLFASYAEGWLAKRKVTPKTRKEYEGLLRLRLLPTFGKMPLRAIREQTVIDWHDAQGTTTPVAKARAYGLLRTMLGDATLGDRPVIRVNPCRIKGASNVRTKKKTKPASVEELAVIVAATPERYRLMVMLAAWRALRFGEVTELRRKDFDLANGVVSIERGVTQVTDVGFVVGDPKSEAGVRDLPIPPFLMPMVRQHLAASISGGGEGLLFPSVTDHEHHLAESTMTKWFYPARKMAGRSDLTFHDLRHTGARLAAEAGALPKDLMRLLGHTTFAMAMRYQHTDDQRQIMIASALPEMSLPDVG